MNWISVSDELPPYDFITKKTGEQALTPMNVLVKHAFGYAIAYYDAKTTPPIWRHTHGSNFPVVDVSHWMYIPPVPQ